MIFSEKCFGHRDSPTVKVFNIGDAMEHFFIGHSWNFYVPDGLQLLSLQSEINGNRRLPSRTVPKK